MKNPEEWMEEIDNGLHYRKEFGREEKWDSLEKSYMHDPAGDTAVGPNLIYEHGDSLLAGLTVPDPDLVVSALNRKGVPLAPIVERLDEQLLRVMQLKNAVDAGLLYSYLFGKMILKVGYDSKYGWSPYYDQGTREQPMGLSLTMFSKKGDLLEFGSQKPGWPWVSAVLPHDFVVPWGCKSLKDAAWCAHRFVRRVDLIKKDPKYRNTSKLEASMTMEDFMKSYSNIGAQRMHYAQNNAAAAMDNKKVAYGEFWEIRNREDNTILVVCRDHDKFLRKDMDAIMAAVGELPFVEGSLVQHPRSFWTTPLAYYLGQLQATQFDISLQSEKSRRINVLRFLVRKGALSDEARTRLMSGDIGVCEEADIGSGQSLREVVAALQPSQMMDYAMHSQANRQDARAMVGFSRNQMGEYDTSSRRTAREATFVQQGSQMRTSKRSQMVIDAYVDSVRKANRLIFAFWQTPRDVLMEEGQWQSVTGPMLKSDYSYDLSLTNRRTVGKAQRKMEAIQMLMTFAQMGFVNQENAGGMLEFVMNAANDPSFEKLLPSPGSNQGGRSPSGGMPTIPGSA